MRKISLLILLLTLSVFVLKSQTASDYYNMGVRKADKMDFKGAKLDFERALDIDPNYANAHNNYAVLLVHSFKDKEGAKEHYEKAIALNSNDPITHFNYAILLRDKYKDRDLAKNEFEKALKLNPKFAAAHYQFAVLLKDYFDDKEGSKKHYMSATRYNSKYINPDFDVDFEIIRTTIEKF